MNGAQYYAHADGAKPDSITFEPLPSSDANYSRSDFYNEQARRLAFHLWDTLPGGTLDQLLAELLIVRGTQLRKSLRSQE